MFAHHFILQKVMKRPLVIVATRVSKIFINHAPNFMVCNISIVAVWMYNYTCKSLDSIHTAKLVQWLKTQLKSMQPSASPLLM